MSLSNSTAPSPRNININILDDFAQTKEDFDICSIPDSDSDSEDEEVTIYYPTPETETEKKIDRSLEQPKEEAKIFHDPLIPNFQGEDGQTQENLGVTTPLPTGIPSRFSTPTTDELIKYINDTGLLGENHDDKSATKSPKTPHLESSELARIRAVITRNRDPGAARTIENSPGGEAEVLLLKEGRLQNPTTQFSEGVPLIRDFAVSNTRILLTAQGNCCINVSEGQDQARKEYTHPGVCTLRHCHGGLFSCAVDDVDAASEEKEEEEVCRELSAGDEADDEDYLYMSGPTPAPAPPRTPLMGIRDTRDLAEIKESEGTDEHFPIHPHHLSESRQPNEKTLKDLRPSPSSTMILTPRIKLHLSIPPVFPQTDQSPRIDAWPTIALAHHIPLFPTHILTLSSLTQLFSHEKHLQEVNGYSASPLDQWALKQHRLFLWINSGALDHGIDGDMRRPRSADALHGIEGGSELWDYEDVEVFARCEGEGFRRCLEWVGEVEGEVDREGWGEGELGLEDQVYDFRWEEEILHRSASMLGVEEKRKHKISSSSSSSECIEEEYDAEDESGETGSPSLAPASASLYPSHDPRLGRVVNIFRTRALQRLGINHRDSPFGQTINQPGFRETGIQAADYARANAMARFERIAEEFAKREKETGGAEDDAGMGDQLGFESVEVHMRGGAGSGDSGKGSNDKSSSTGMKPPNPQSPSTSSDPKPKPKTSKLHSNLLTQLENIKSKIPPHLSIPHAIKTLNQKLLLHSSTPKLLVRTATTHLPTLINNLLPTLSPSSLLKTSNTILSAHVPVQQKLVDKLVEIPAQIKGLPSRASHWISEIQKRREERGKREDERAARLKNNEAVKSDTEVLRLREQIWRNMKENLFKKRWGWEYSRKEKGRDGEDDEGGEGKKKKK
ncbi:hypothetical protein EAE96_009920 [Botrytis aclada]|nr:hypothetical protein EAE96_009920 [Botrytis aclada]